MSMKTAECFSYTCPHCHAATNAVQVAAALPAEILLAEAARHSGRRQRRHAGPGRPTIVRCPGCDNPMSAADLRQHRLACVRSKLQQIQRLSLRIRLSPKDPDPYPDFYMAEIGEADVTFSKGSNSDQVTVDLNKVAQITIDHQGKIAHIRVLGHIGWHEDIKRWRFAPSRIGRPPLN
jgi:hypothetical protein